MLMKKSKLCFLATKGCNAKINDPIWPVFKLTFPPYLQVSNRIKTEGAMLMTKSKLCFFSN